MSIAAWNMRYRSTLMAGIILTVSFAAGAQRSGADQTDSAQKAPVDAGAIIMPSETDPAAVRKPPENMDHGIVIPVDKKDRQNQQSMPDKKPSKDTACQGQDELCKQSSPH